MIIIREGRADDVETLLEMLQASAEDQGFPDEVGVTIDNLLTDGFGAQPKFRTLFAQSDGEPVGMAVYFFNYSTWGSRYGLYLEDLYVRPAFRGQRVARLLMQQLASVALENECGRFQWVVHAGNERALRFYESLGAQRLSDWLLMSVKGSDLEKLRLIR